MPLSVELPTRIRIDAAALAGEGEEALGEALGAAVRRALIASRDAVLAPRGSYAGVRLHHPEFAWSGDGLDAVSTARRMEIEDLVDATLLAAAEVSGVLDLARASEEIDLPLMGDPSETIDDRRYGALLRLYRLPAYDDRGREQLVDVVRTVEPAPAGVVVDVQREWLELRSEQDYDTAYAQARADSGVQLPGDGYFGAIFHSARGIGIRIRHNPGNTSILNIALSGLMRLVPRGSGRHRRLVLESASRSPGAGYHFRWYGPGSTEPERLATLRRFWTERVQALLQEEWERLSQDIQHETTSVADYRQRLPDLVDAHVALLLNEHRSLPNTLCYGLLEGDGASDLISLPVVIPSDLDIDLVALTHLVPGPRDNRPGHGAGGSVGETEAGGAGSGAGEGTGVGDGHGPGGRTGIVWTGEEGSASRGAVARYPQSRIPGRAAQRCAPFWGEPSLDRLGPAGSVVRSLIAEIADKLDIAPCPYPGRFCLIATEAVAGRAAAVAEQAVESEGFTEPVGTGRGNLGLLEFRPTASPAIQFMRHLASVVALIDKLHGATMDLMRDGDRGALIEDGYPGWLLHLTIDFDNAMNQAVGWIFTQTCGSFMLQLLRAAAKGIGDRQANLTGYASLFERMMLHQIADIAELRQLRLTLKDALPRASALAAVAEPIAEAWRTVHYSNWQDAQRGVLDLLNGRDERPLSPGKQPVELVRRGPEIVGIRDASGRAWTLLDLDMAIATKEEIAQAIDPFVKQVVDTPGMLDRFRRNRHMIREELALVLEEMRQHNLRITAEVRADPMYAFRIARLGGNLPGYLAPVSQFPLQAIHRQAHEQVGEFFRGTPSYSRALRSLFATEMGRADLLMYAEIGGTVLLAVVCAPAAIVVGVLLGGYHLHEAMEREGVLSSVFDSDLLVVRAEVEAELFAAQLGMLLSIVPVAGSVTRPVASGVSVAARSGAQAGLRVFTTGVRQNAMIMFAHGLKHGLVLGIVREAVTMEFMNLALGKLLVDPVIEALEREFPAYDRLPPASPPTEGP